MLAEVTGSGFSRGFTSGFIGHYAPVESITEALGYNNVITRTAVAAGLGGTASALNGGSFANGAESAAYVHLYNSETETQKVIDSTFEAVLHYFFGNGETVELGPYTKSALRNHPLFQRQSNALKAGTATHRTGNLSVDMEGEVYHVGKTRVDFSTVCQSGSCTTTYTGFSNDGFWDPTAAPGFGDGMGGDWEFYGGTGYHYNTYTRSETYTNNF